MTSKRDLSEHDICTRYITPALQQAGWNIATQIREEVTFTEGKIYVKGNLTSRDKKKRQVLADNIANTAIRKYGQRVCIMKNKGC